MPSLFQRLTQPIRTFAKATTFFLKIFPMLPSRPVNWVTKTPVIEKVRYPTLTGEAEGEIYLPGTDGPHPGMVVCLGVVPFGVDHPQVPVLGNALARAGYAVLLYWSPAMREFRFDTADIENIALAYDWLISQPYIDPSRSGLLGTCVGGSFAMMAAAQPLVHNRVAFVSGYAPFSSMPIFARDIASATRSGEHGREPWKVDQLTRKVFVHSLAGWLEPEDAERIHTWFGAEGKPGDWQELSADGQAVYALLSAQDESQAEAALEKLPIRICESSDYPVADAISGEYSRPVDGFFA